VVIRSRRCFKRSTGPDPEQKLMYDLIFFKHCTSYITQLEPPQIAADTRQSDTFIINITPASQA
jgi:hypothetical protein